MSSVVRGDEILYQAEWLIYGEKSFAKKLTMIKNITLISSINLLLFAGPLDLSLISMVRNGTDALVETDDWVKFTIDEREAKLLFDLRTAFTMMFKRFLQNHSDFQPTLDESQILDVIASVIKQEDTIEKVLKIKRAIALNQYQ